jgi:Uma2 family endonuclease
MSVPARQFITPGEYLEGERSAGTRSEYFNGEVFAMAGASRNLNLLCANLVREISSQLRSGPCEVYPIDMRVKVSATGLYTYPDLAVVCDEPQFEDGHLDTLLNPTLIVEVLSPSTEAYDRGDKFAQYRKLQSLQEYVLISQDRARVERFTRQAEGDEWLFAEVSDLESAVVLSSVGCTLRLSDIYERVQFPEDPPARPR